MVDPRPKPPESLTQRLEFLEQENAELRRRLLVDDLSEEVRDRVYGWLKGIGTSALAAATVLGISSFAALSSIASNQTRKVATEIATQQAREIPLEQLTDEVSQKLVTGFQQDSDFEAKLIELLAQNPAFLQQVSTNAIQNDSLQGQLQTEIETIAKATLIETATQAAQQTGNQPTENAASAIANAAKQEVKEQRFYVVLRAADDAANLQAAAQEAQRQGLKTQTCGPKPENQQSALVVTGSERFLLDLEAAERLEAQAKLFQADAYAVLQSRAFFTCA